MAGTGEGEESDDDGRPLEDQPFKKRRLVAQPEMWEDREDSEDGGNLPAPVAVAQVVIHDED